MMKLFSADPPSQPPGPYPECSCFDQEGSARKQRTPVLHAEPQDTRAAGWLRLLDRVEEAIRTGQEEFAPLDGMSGLERSQVVTLPTAIEHLVHVRKLRLYGSHIARIPPQIGGMQSLAYLDLYTSYRLHFFPYEITRCRNLRDSRVSTRALFGNYKHRPPFPELTHRDNARPLSLCQPMTCSVCTNSPAGPPILRWITLTVGSDWLPLLVSACSTACIDALPTPASGYVQHPHVGGARIIQPPAE